jgi:hypothetical protein
MYHLLFASSMACISACCENYSMSTSFNKKKKQGHTLADDARPPYVLITEIALFSNGPVMFFKLMGHKNLSPRVNYDIIF